MPGSTDHQDAGRAPAAPATACCSRPRRCTTTSCTRGDLIRLRLQTGADHAYRPVAFHVLGQVTEWPTAPKDSFIVANADYLDRADRLRRGRHLPGLHRTPRPVPRLRCVRQLLRHRIGRPGAGRLLGGVPVSPAPRAWRRPTCLGSPARPRVRGPAGPRLLRAGAAGRHRRTPTRPGPAGRTGSYTPPTRAVPGERGTRPGRLRSARRRPGGATIAYLLVKVLTGIFDPPPAAATVPWALPDLLLAVVVGVTVLVVAGVGRLVARAGPSELRDL